jgi:hypothetical protein
LRAASKQEKDDWVAALKSHCQKGTLSPDQQRHLRRSASSFLGKTPEEQKK